MSKIKTQNICPPIPIRKFDWEAYREDWDEGWPIGYGETEQEAIRDLLLQEEEISDALDCDSYLHDIQIDADGRCHLCGSSIKRINFINQ